MAYQHLLRNGASYAWMVCGVGATCAYMYPHTFGLDKFIDDHITTTNGKPDKMDKNILLLAEMNKKSLDWERFGEMTGSTLRFFPHSSLEFVHQGSMATQWGGAIGVPVLFGDRSLQRAMQDSTWLQKYNIDVNTDTGKQLVETFRLSSNAQRFVLAREMTEAKSSQLYFNGVTLGISFPLVYVLSQVASQLVPFTGAKLASLCFFVPVVMFGNIRFIDWSNCSLQKRADKKAAGISEDIAKGGVEYYDSVIQRMNVIRQDSLDTGVTQLKHDSVFYFVNEKRKPSLTIEERKNYLIEVIEKQYGAQTSKEQKT